MFTRPPELDDADVARTLTRGWGVDAARLDYVAVGFGSHHWRVSDPDRRWFLNVDDLDARQFDATDTRADAACRLAGALTMARDLREQGLDFVVAPVPTRTGAVLEPIDDRFVAALYEHVDGTSFEWGTESSRAERLAVVDRLVAIHGTSLATGSPADDFALPQRANLEEVLRDPSASWGPGPYTAPARDLVRQHRDAVRRVIDRYDELVRRVTATAPHFTPTHGEPHRGNRMQTADGLALVDWDTALLAPPERDLWALVDEDARVASDYAERSGRTPDPMALALYRLRWDLTEIALYVRDFRAPHSATEDAELAWSSLSGYLDPNRWSDA